jgi:DNA-binding LacI/PurR family transcriptional regulator
MDSSSPEVRNQATQRYEDFKKACERWKQKMKERKEESERNEASQRRAAIQRMLKREREEAEPLPRA